MGKTRGKHVTSVCIALFVGFLSTVLARKCTLGPDFSIVHKDTYFTYGYELTRRVLQMSQYDPVHKNNALHDVSLRTLAYLDLKIYNFIQELDLACPSVACQSNLLEFLESAAEYLEDFEESYIAPVNFAKESKKDVEVGSVIGENPLTVYRMIRRYRNFIQPWASKRKGQNLTDIQNTVRNFIRKNYDYTEGPLRMDYHISMIALISIQFQLQLKASEVAMGILDGIETGTKLKAIHCLDLGVHAFASGVYVVGIEYLELAVAKVKSGDPSVDLSLALHWLNVAKTTHDEKWSSLNLPNLEGTFYQEPLSILEISNNTQRRWNRRSIAKVKDRESWIPMETYWKVCTKQSQQSVAEKSRLYCWLEAAVHPTWKIRPLRVEVLAMNPGAETILIHDLISDTDALRVKSTFVPSLFESTIADDAPYNPKSRFSLCDQNFKKAEKLVYPPMSKKLDILAGLVTGFKSFGTPHDIHVQISSYAPGGHILPHPDGAGTTHSGDLFGLRFVTFVYHLDEPEAGGSTGFPYTLVRANPGKGSAIFWFNLNQSGELDKTSLHGACPLILGRRWVGIKFLNHPDQHQIKCDKDASKKFEFLQNGRSKYMKQSRVF